MHFHRRIELRLAIRFAEFRAAIKTDRQFRFRDFAGLRHANGVYARQQPRSARAGERDLRGRRNPRWLLAHAPGHAIKAGTLARGQFIHDAPGGIQHFDLQFAEEMARPLVVGNDRSVRRIIADEDGVAIGPAAVALNSLLHRAARRRRRLPAPNKSGVSARSGVMSSTIQMPRPCVARTRSLSRG